MIKAGWEERQSDEENNVSDIWKVLNKCWFPSFLPFWREHIVYNLLIKLTKGKGGDGIDHSCYLKYPTYTSNNLLYLIIISQAKNQSLKEITHFFFKNLLLVITLLCFSEDHVPMKRKAEESFPESTFLWKFLSSSFKSRHIFYMLIHSGKEVFPWIFSTWDLIRTHWLLPLNLSITILCRFWSLLGFFFFFLVF